MIRAAVVAHVARHRQTSCWKREAGGQLFARIDGDDWMVEEATGPRRGDSRSRFGFRPNRRAEQREIDDRFAVGLHYVGDWHTHPGPNPEPSPMDLASMQAMVRASRHELPGFLMMIVGTDPGSASFWVSMHLVGGSWRRYNLQSTN